MSHRAPRCPFCGAPRAVVELGGGVPVAALEAGRGQTVTQFCDHKAVADECVQDFAAAGLVLDYSTASIAALDQLLTDRFGPSGAGGEDERWKPDEDLRRLIALVGSYVGESVRRRFGGDWADDPDHPGKPLFVRLELAESGTVWPLERAYRRLKSGVSESLWKYADLIAKEIGGPLDDSAMAWASQASDMIRGGRLELAQRFLDRAVSIDPELTEAWFCRGLVHEQLGRKVDATYCYDQALKFERGRDPALRAHLEEKVADLRAVSVGTHEAARARGAAAYPSAAFQAIPEKAPRRSDTSALLDPSDLALRETGSRRTVDDGADASDPPTPPHSDDRLSTANALSLATADTLHALPKERREPPATLSGPTDVEDSTPPTGFDFGDQPVNDAGAGAETVFGPPGLQAASRARDQGPPTLPSLDELLSTERPPARRALEPVDEAPRQPSAAASAAPSADVAITDATRGAQIDNTQPVDEDAAAFVRDGRSLFAAARFSEALTCFDQALSVASDYREARLLLATAALAIGESGAALGAVEALCERGDIDALALRVRALWQADDLHGALASADAILKRDMSSTAGWRLRASCLVALGRHSDARDAYTKVAQREPGDPSVWLALARCSIRLDDTKRARLALGAYLGVESPSEEIGLRFAQRELARLTVR